MGLDQAHRPFLELLLGAIVAVKETLRPGQILRHAVHLEFGALAKGVIQPRLDQADGQMGDADADPFAPEFLGGVDRGAAAAEQVEHHIAGVGGGIQDALQRGDGFLGGIAEAISLCREIPPLMTGASRPALAPPNPRGFLEPNLQMPVWLLRAN